MLDLNEEFVKMKNDEDTRAEKNKLHREKWDQIENDLRNAILRFAADQVGGSLDHEHLTIEGNCSNINLHLKDNGEINIDGIVLSVCNKFDGHIGEIRLANQGYKSIIYNVKNNELKFIYPNKSWHDYSSGLLSQETKSLRKAIACTAKDYLECMEAIGQ